MVDRIWRQTPITYEQWQANCRASSHVRKSDVVTFNTSCDCTTTAWIEGTSVFLGAYFTKGNKNDGILDGTGWNHE